ncbi:hypothetical protein ACEUZ9_000136 [Paracoccus litorisediminis]|uniref:hypothetical protein n=1 Tax=Paracoccus litorisediminis TaxID=2006130 RepID=UPI00372FA8DD
MSAPGVYIWRGRIYVGVRAVAQAAGVTEHTVSYHLNRHGNLDRLGVASGGNNGACGKPVELFGRCWRSRTALADYVGRSDSRVSRWIRVGRSDLLLAALMRADARQAVAA